MNQDKQPEALRLADELEQFRSFPALAAAAAAELLLLHAESEQHLQELRSYRITVEKREARIAELESQLAAAQQGVQQIQANCYSNDDGDYWRDCPDDCDFVEGLKVGDTFELQASIRAWSETYRVTKAPDDTSDDYEVELVSSDAPIATNPTTQGLDAIKEARNTGINHGICLALQLMTSHGAAGSTQWEELVDIADRSELEHYAKVVAPEEWELAGFAHVERFRAEIDAIGNDAAQAKQGGV